MPRRPRVLLLTHRVPFPPDRGDRIRAFHLLRNLAKHADVTVACPVREPLSDAQRRAFQKLAKGVILEIDTPAARLRRLAAARLRGDALTPANFYLPKLAQRLVDVHTADPFDAVVAFCTGMHGYVQRLRDLPLPPPRCILDMVDLDSAKWADLAQPKPPATDAPPTPASPRQRSMLRAPLAAARRIAYRYEAAHLSKLERDIARAYQTISFVNPAEADAYRRAAIPDVPRYRIGRSFAEVIASTNGVDLKHYTPSPRSLKSKTVLFTGVLDYAPNVDGLAWFVEHCLPQLRADVPDTTLRIVGKNPGAAVRRLAAQPGVELVGPVPDTRPHLHDAAIVIAPLHVAPGVQNKVLEAMAAGRPVVATPQAASGIDATPGTHLLTAAHPTRFALLCAFLLTQPRHANQIATLARRRVEQRHRWSAALAPLVDRIVTPARPSARDAPTPPLRLAA